MMKNALHFFALTLAISGIGATLVMGAANAATPTNPPHMAQHKATQHTAHHTAKVTTSVKKTTTQKG